MGNPLYPGTQPGQFVFIGGFWVPLSTMTTQTVSGSVSGNAPSVVSQASPAVINSTATPMAQKSLTVAALDSVIPLPYGQSRVPALLCNVLSFGGNLVFWVIWGAGPIKAIDSITLNDAPLDPGFTVRNYLGTNSQGVDPLLAEAFAAVGGLPTFLQTLPGISYSVIWGDPSLVSGPVQFNAVGRWKLVYDPRLDDTNGGTGPQRGDDQTTWDFSRNPTLILVNFLGSVEYGQGKTFAWPSVIASANANDALVGTGSDAEPKRLCDIIIDREASIDSWTATLRTAAACWLYPVGDVTYLIPDAPTASEASYNHALGNVLGVSAETIAAPRNLPTVVEIIWTDPSALPWRDAPTNPPAMRPGVSDGSTPWRKVTIRMPWVTRLSQALREGVEWMNKLWLGNFSLTLDILDEGIRHQTGNVIDLTYPDSGYAMLPLRVLKSLPSLNGFTLNCRKEDPAMYSSDVQSGPSVPNTNLSP